MTRRALFALAAVFGLRKQVPSVTPPAPPLAKLLEVDRIPFCLGEWIVAIPPAEFEERLRMEQKSIANRNLWLGL